jgi:hypothetical protein
MWRWLFALLFGALQHLVRGESTSQRKSENGRRAGMVSVTAIIVK